MIISKVGDRKTMNEFRLISLIECQYKINGKLLANRSREVMATRTDGFDVDDVMLILTWDLENVNHLICILRCFLWFQGLKSI